jgi:hypothetical protein
MPKKMQSQSHFFRHLGALMKKNAINWRRTCCGSITEIMCPVVLVFLLVWIRTIDGLVSTSDAKNPMQLQSLMYAPATAVFDQANPDGIYSVEFEDIIKNLSPMLTYSDYAETNE